jgi:hypothetical protein
VNGSEINFRGDASALVTLFNDAATFDEKDLAAVNLKAKVKSLPLFA